MQASKAPMPGSIRRLACDTDSGLVTTSAAIRSLRNILRIEPGIADAVIDYTYRRQDAGPRCAYAIDGHLLAPS